MQEHVLTIPDELIEWGADPAVSITMPRPWAHQVAELVSQSEVEPLSTADTERLLGRLEGLIGCAIDAGRSDLLLGIDLLTAEWLGMVFTWHAGEHEMQIGRGERWNYQELRELLGSSDPRKAAKDCERVKSAASAAFPDARIGEIIGRTQSTHCEGCGLVDEMMMITMTSGNSYCMSCYDDLTRSMSDVWKTR